MPFVRRTPRTISCRTPRFHSFLNLPQSSLPALPLSSLYSSLLNSHFRDAMFLPRKRRRSTHNKLPPLSRFDSFSPHSLPLTQLSPCAQRRLVCARLRASTTRYSPATSLSGLNTHTRSLNAPTFSLSASPRFLHTSPNFCIGT